ncbi:hypothetical protein JL721_8057 [Aureococcus anophagefferens]|nr:hypothetical protein JL721_8057 [Aureococcus anophagefferens]
MAGLPKLRALLLAVAGVGALRSAPSRFANRGSAASARKRILPVLRPEGGAPALMPVPGLKRRLRYALSGAAQVAFVGDLKKYGACVRLLDDGTGVVCGVSSPVPYTAVECGPCADDEAPSEDDPLAPYDVVDGLGSVEDEREKCFGVLKRTLELCDRIDGALRAVDGLGEPLPEGEYGDARSPRAACLDEDARSGALARVARHAGPLYKELAAIASLMAAAAGKRPPRPRRATRPRLRGAPPGRRVSYWWSEDLGWASGTVKATPASESVTIDFDAPEGDVESHRSPSAARRRSHGADPRRLRRGVGDGRDLARRKARDAVHSKWDSHPEVTKKPSVRDMENELPEGMKFVDNESNATEREEAEYWIGHNQKSALKKERHVIETTRGDDRDDALAR